MKKVAVLGGGSWGTALAVVLRERFETFLWVRGDEEGQKLLRDRENKKYLPGVELGNLRVTSDLADALGGAVLVVLAVPVKALREVLSAARAHLAEGQLVLSTSKGIEVEGFKRPSEVVVDSLFPGAKVVVLSGPSHAEEVARRVPTTVVCASEDREAMRAIQNMCTTEWFRLYTNDDLVGVELAGALKNVIAIASGMIKGMGYGINTSSSLISRGTVEICRLGVHLGAKEGTFFGLAGVGDLIATSLSNLSRNFKVGLELGKGRTLDEVLASMTMVAEGVGTIQAVHNYVKEHKIEMPITEALYKVVFGSCNPNEVLSTLMRRRLKAEFTMQGPSPNQANP